MNPNAQDLQHFEALLDYLKRSRGFDFTAYKRSTLIRRVQRRMQMINIPDFVTYLDYLEVHPEEFAELFNTVLINVTGFFRDLPSWEALAQDIIPKILANKSAGEQIRVWSAGCSSGEEAYTTAMLFCEAMGPEAFRDRVKIYATDVDEEALNQARAAAYPDKDVADVPAALAAKYFERHNGSLVFNRDLRRAIIFGRNDLIQDAPISRVDLLICRNTLMYLNSEMQARILERFHFALNDSGFLFMGRAEMLLLHANLFAPVQLKRRIFTKIPARRTMRDRLLTIANGNGSEPADPAANHRLREAAFEADPAAQILVEAPATILLINSGARSLFGLQPSDVGRTLADVDLPYRHMELLTWVTQASAERRPLFIKEIEITQPGNLSQKTRYLDVVVLPLIDNTGAILGVKLTFMDVTRAHDLNESLQQSRQELETAFEELQTTNEELQSTVEELETTNEELQSTNEEMETMNEELQSTNTELQTMNQELAKRSQELNQVNAFLESILTSFHSGVAILDTEFNVLVWNNQAEELWGARAGELNGKNIVKADIGLPVEKLLPYLKTTLAKNDGRAHVTLDAVNRRGRPIKCQVTLSPLSTDSKPPHGVIMLMDDVSQHG